MRTVKASVLASYIEQQNMNDELTEWCVAIVSKAEPESSINVKGHLVGCVYRKPFPDGSLTDTEVTIKRLISPFDERLDLTEAVERAREYDRKW